ncbi:MAG: hypothetical protein HQ565_02360 [Bacteroidetes bacterium]|nr:hypothetical protein [Bacteroidota bacterium]
MILSYPEPQKDFVGLFYDHLPEQFRLATIDDFHEQGKKKTGMIFLVRWVEETRYSVWDVDENLTGEKIIPFIREKRVFVLRDDQ